MTDTDPLAYRTTPAQNSPACATQHAAAARNDFAGTPLSQTPTAALAFALGYVITQPVRAEQFGGFCALVEELEKPSRMVSRPCSSIPRTALGELLEVLPADLSRKIVLLYGMQRGQRWRHTGQPNADGRGPDTGSRA